MATRPKRIDAAAVEAFGPRLDDGGIIELTPSGAVDRFSHTLRSADTAAYAAKHAGGNRIPLVTADLAPIHRQGDEGRVRLISRALRDSQFALRYTRQ